ncbi:hypothetical protein [Haliea atlantica]
MNLISVGVFSCLILGTTFWGARFVRSFAIRFIFLLHSAGVLLMLLVPAIFHSATNFSSLGFLGFSFESKEVARNVVYLYLSVSYVYVLTAVGFSLVARFFSSRLMSFELPSVDRKESKCLAVLIFFLICLLFFISYYGSFGSILMLRNRESLNLPVHFELLRAAVIAASTYSLLLLSTTRFTLYPFLFLGGFALFSFSLVLLIGFGSRNLLVFPVCAIFATLAVRQDPKLTKRNYILACSALLVLFGIAVLQSDFRDDGIQHFGFDALNIFSPFLAFDQFQSLYLTFETYDVFFRAAYRLPFSIFFDFFVYYVPSGWLEHLGVTKASHLNYIAWNHFVTSSVESNVTPSHVGQSLIEAGWLGLLFLPVCVTLVLFILLRILAASFLAGRSHLVMLTGVSLIAGGFFNIVRIFSGAYFLYFLVFIIVIAISDFIASSMARRKANKLG